MQLPLFGVEMDSGDITLFEKLSDAESYIESYDIDTWQVFDSAGGMCKIEPGKIEPMVKITTEESIEIRQLMPIIGKFLARPSTAGSKIEAEIRKVLMLVDKSK